MGHGVGGDAPGSLSRQRTRCKGSFVVENPQFGFFGRFGIRLGLDHPELGERNGRLQGESERRPSIFGPSVTRTARTSAARPGSPSKAAPGPRSGAGQPPLSGTGFHLFAHAPVRYSEIFLHVKHARPNIPAARTGVKATRTLRRQGCRLKIFGYLDKGALVVGRDREALFSKTASMRWLSEVVTAVNFLMPQFFAISRQ